MIGIEYIIQPGNSLAAIAFRFNSTVEDILEKNEDLEDVKHNCNLNPNPVID